MSQMLFTVLTVCMYVRVRVCVCVCNMQQLSLELIRDSDGVQGLIYLQRARLTDILILYTKIHTHITQQHTNLINS